MFRQFRIVSNYTCNNRCKFCYTKSLGFQKLLIKKDNIKKIIDNMYRLWSKKCILIWWEPTLHPDLFEIIKYWKDKWMFMKIVTNGRIFKKKDFLEKLIDNWLNFIALSIHWHTPEIDSENTGVKDSFSDTIQWIKNCISSKIPFVTLTTLNKNNFKYVKEIVSFLTDIWVKNIIFNLWSPIEWVESIENDILTPIEIAESIQNAYNVLKQNNLKAKFYASIPLCLFESDLLISMIEDSYLIPISGWDISECNVYDGSWIAFDPLWNILTCTHRVKSPVKKILNKNKKVFDFDEFVTILKEVEKHVWTDNWKWYSDKCTNCHLKDICIWWCELYWNYFSPDNYIKWF